MFYLIYYIYTLKLNKKMLDLLLGIFITLSVMFIIILHVESIIIKNKNNKMLINNEKYSYKNEENKKTIAEYLKTTKDTSILNNNEKNNFINSDDVFINPNKNMKFARSKIIIDRIDNDLYINDYYNNNQIINKLEKNLIKKIK